jgi:hypothetical protein
VRINELLLGRKVAAPVWKTEINDRRGSAALTTRHPSIHKVGAKFRQEVAVAPIILPVVLYGCEIWSLTVREEHKLRVFENRVLRRIFGPKRDGVTGG